MRTRVSTLCLALATACAGPATLQLQNGREVTGTIERSGVESIWVKTEEGQEMEVNRGDVVDVSHPGAAQMVLGGALVAVGAGMTATVPEYEPGNGREQIAQYMLGAGFIAAGASLALAGVIARGRSTSRYEPSFTVGRRGRSQVAASGERGASVRQSSGSRARAW